MGSVRRELGAMSGLVSATLYAISMAMGLQEQQINFAQGMQQQQQPMGMPGQMSPFQPAGVPMQQVQQYNVQNALQNMQSLMQQQPAYQNTMQQQQLRPQIVTQNRQPQQPAAFHGPLPKPAVAQVPPGPQRVETVSLAVSPNNAASQPTNATDDKAAPDTKEASEGKGALSMIASKLGFHQSSKQQPPVVEKEAAPGKPTLSEVAQMLAPQPSPVPSPAATTAPAAASTTTPTDTGTTIAPEWTTAWSYSGDVNGPTKWASLDPSWEACGTGKKQSPINVENVKIGTRESSTLPLLVPSLKPSLVTMKNNGKFIKLAYDEGSTVKLGDNVFNVQEFSFHSPSEHQINGQTYAMEMQILCTGTVEGKPVNAIIAVLMQSHQNERMKNQFLDTFWDDMPKTANTMVKKNATINLADLLPKDISYHASTGGLRIAYPYYFYEGSLSYPPCKEGAKYFLWYKPVDVFEEQVIQYQKLLEKMDIKQGNARAAQPLGDREIEFKTLF